VRASDEAGTVWMGTPSQVFQVDMQGNELQRVTLPLPETYYAAKAAFSHDGRLLAYLALPPVTFPSISKMMSWLRLYDTQTQRLLLDHPLNEDGVGLYYSAVMDSSFSSDDAKFAFGYNRIDADGWDIHIFDTESGAILQTLSSETLKAQVFDRIRGEAPP